MKLVINCLLEKTLLTVPYNELRTTHVSAVNKAAQIRCWEHVTHILEGFIIEVL